MQHLPPTDVLRRGLRSRICTKCYQRPAGTEALSGLIPRSCERRCPIFAHLPTLMEIVEQIDNDDAPLQTFENAIEKRICERCPFTSSPGDYCANRMTRTCPLSRYLDEIVLLIAGLRDRRIEHSQAHN